MHYTLAELARLTNTQLVGDGSKTLSELASLTRARETSISFLVNSARADELTRTQARCGCHYRRLRRCHLAWV
jgi:UDP-3-O-[3-hydroxymyristoyl] glucosamine N-acyltransferase